MMDKINVAWELVGQIAVGMGIIVGLVQAYKYLKSQSSIGKLEVKVNSHDEYLQKDKAHLERIDARLDNIEKETNDEMKAIKNSLNNLGSSIASIMNHMIDGNGVDRMREERDKLVKYFIKRE